MKEKHTSATMLESAVSDFSGLSSQETNDQKLRTYLNALPGIDAVGLEARAQAFASRSLKTSSKRLALDTIISLMDLTTLEGTDTPHRVRSLVSKAIYPDARSLDCPRVAAVCVYPDMVVHAKNALGAFHGDQEDGKISIASVSTAFPSGRAPLDVKIRDTKAAISAGADEIDMVIDRGAFLSGRYAQVFEEIVRIKEVCVREDGRTIPLKVILETGELRSYGAINKACHLAILAGADFIKTSTGKIPQAATLPVTVLMLSVVKQWHLATGKSIGVKAAGGIRTSKDAIRYLVAAAEVAGTQWLTPHLFRFGASSLLNDVLMQRQKMDSGHYSGHSYVSID